MLFGHLILDLQSSQQFLETHHWHRNKPMRTQLFLTTCFYTGHRVRINNYEQNLINLQILLVFYKLIHNHIFFC